MKAAHHNTIQNNYVMAKALAEQAFGALEGEGTDAQWEAMDEADAALIEAKNQLLEWGKEVALKMIRVKEDRENVKKLFEMAGKNYNVEQELIKNTLRLDTRK